ncbi:hypothetical protein CISG_05548 [Coccidioides immitis RMSCC 3703]|uniref:Uncharacterized protein n=2 Tax=Coccidioides immitis TaxID=5501 RepID=A0A0J8QVV1_COCIT|nr:hypothetical protein CIRG_02773 [Coccidioides immitis RMSCC 2394]KMU76180.1 hypothetical protein CISG_05548 [Coccidioides immitis RMSCC 3703]
MLFLRFPEGLYMAESSERLSHAPLADCTSPRERCIVGPLSTLAGRCGGMGILARDFNLCGGSALAKYISILKDENSETVHYVFTFDVDVVSNASSKLHPLILGGYTNGNHDHCARALFPRVRRQKASRVYRHLA